MRLDHSATGNGTRVTSFHGLVALRTGAPGATPGGASQNFDFSHGLGCLLDAEPVGPSGGVLTSGDRLSQAFQQALELRLAVLDRPKAAIQVVQALAHVRAQPADVLLHLLAQLLDVLACGPLPVEHDPRDGNAHGQGRDKFRAHVMSSSLSQSTAFLPPTIQESR